MFVLTLMIQSVINVVSWRKENWMDKKSHTDWILFKTHQAVRNVYEIEGFLINNKLVDFKWLVSVKILLLVCCKL